MPDQGTADALAIARLVHDGQKDKGGVPYIEHVIHVSLHAAADAPDGMKADAAIVGLLHDTIEDGDNPAQIRGLILATFGERILAAVEALTHLPGEDYATYVERIAANPLARIVKVADLRHNMDATRVVGAKPPKAAKYAAALARLEA